MIFAGEPAPRRRRAAGRQVQRRAGADYHHDGRRDKATGEISFKEVTLSKDEGPRPDTQPKALRVQAGAGEGFTITAGNASQLSDGASASVIMSDKRPPKRGLKPLASPRFVAAAASRREWASVRCSRCRAPAQRLLENRRHRSWELNEALRCRCSIAATSSASTLKRSTSMAARSAVAIPKACRRAPDRSRPDRGPPRKDQICRGDHVRRRRHGRGGLFGVAVTLAVVPAKAGTHTPRPSFGHSGRRLFYPRAPVLWVPRSRGRREESNSFAHRRIRGSQLSREEVASREVRAFFRTTCHQRRRQKLQEGRHLGKQEMIDWCGILNRRAGASRTAEGICGTGWTSVQHYIFNEELQMAPAPAPLAFASAWSAR